jgi:hypothetical protein
VARAARNRRGAADAQDRFAPAAAESQLHRTVAEFLDWMLLKPAVWTTFPAGWGKLGKATAGSLKGAGLKAGLPDILVFHDHEALGIELKTAAGKVTAIQAETHKALAAAGVPVYVCRSVEAVAEALVLHKIPMRKYRWQDRRGLKSTPLAAT